MNNSIAPTYPASARRTRAGRVELSVLVPVFNEAAMLDRFLARLLPVMHRLQMSYEVVFVDDGSSDDTLARLVALQQANPAIRIVALSRNFGKEAATTAGLDHVSGAAVVPIDCDLQDPPEVIEQLVQKWREGFEVVIATRRAREGESWLKRATAAAFYRAFNLVARQPIPPDTGDFRLLDRRVLRAIRRLPERTRFMKGLFAWVGFSQTAVLYDREPRCCGRSKWNYGRLWNLAVQGITSFSTLPLRIWTYLGAGWLAICLLLGMFDALHFLVPSVPAATMAWSTFIIFLLSGVQLMAVGVVGEYVACLMEEAKGRPVYLVAHRYGFGPRRWKQRRAGRRKVLLLPAESAPVDRESEPTPSKPPAAA